MAPWPGSSGWRSRSRSRRAGCPRSSPPARPRGEPSRGVIFPKYRGDLLEAAVVVRRMHEGAIETTRLPRNPLDVLAQQIVAATADRAWAVDELYALARRAENYAELGRDAFEAVLAMLAGQYPSDEFAELRPRVVWGRVAHTVQARRGAPRGGGPRGRPAPRPRLLRRLPGRRGRRRAPGRGGGAAGRGAASRRAGRG